MNLKLKTMLSLTIFSAVVGMSRNVSVNATTPDAEIVAYEVVGDALPQGERSAFGDDFSARVMEDGSVIVRPRSMSELLNGMHEPVPEERLIDAVYDGNFGLVRQLVNSGEIDVNRDGYYGLHTPLSMASYRWLVPGGAEMIIFLLNHGADPSFVAADDTMISDDNGNYHRPNIYETWQESLRSQRRAGVRLNEDVVDALERAFQDAFARLRNNA